MSSATATHDDDFLRRLGERVRAARSQAGLSRRALSDASRVSERYIAQLEAGSGNISITLLRGIAQALALPLEALTTEPVAHERARIDAFLDRLTIEQLATARTVLERAVTLPNDADRRERIALIGLRGAGKSTLGARLADRLRLPFIELDRAIETEAGIPLATIFDLYGAAGYRRLEAASLDAVLGAHQRCVIATGGSIVNDEVTFARLRASCFTVWLKASAAEHMDRVLAQGDTRPMAGNPQAMAELERILTEREALYRLADIEIDTSGRSVDASSAVLANALERRLTAQPL